MPRFGVHRVQMGQGCDYTIRCGEVFELLPESIETKAEAIEYVLRNRYPDEGFMVLERHTDDLKSCIIYEISDSHEFNLRAMEAEYNRAENEQAEKEAEEAEYQKFLEMKAKFEGNGQ